MKLKPHIFFPVLVVIALTFAGLGCGSENSGSVVSTSVPKSTSAPAPMQVYKVGEVVKVKDHTVTLNSAGVQNGILKANFTIANAGPEIIVSSLLSFSAKDSDGTKLEITIGCGSPLDGKVLSGDKLRGDLCYKTTAATPFKIYYEANLLGSGAIVWEVK